MDLLEIRKKAKLQRKPTETVTAEPPAKSPRPSAEQDSVEDAVAVELTALHTHGESEPVTDALPTASAAVGGQADEFDFPDDWEDQLREGVAAHEDDDDALPSGDADFLELASEELFRHTYDLDQPEDEQQREVLLCRIADEEYGIDIHRIKEIIKLRSITEIPRAPKFILGIITLRGTVIPVLDLRERLRLETADFTRQNKIVVVQYNGQFFGLIVDAVLEVSQVPESSVEDTPSIMVGVEGRFIEGIGRSGEQMIILLKLDEVLDIDFKPAA